VGETCSMHVETKISQIILFTTAPRKKLLGDRGVDWKIILKWILKTQSVKEWARFNWRRNVQRENKHSYSIKTDNILTYWVNTTARTVGKIKHRDY